MAPPRVGATPEPETCTSVRHVQGEGGIGIDDTTHPIADLRRGDVGRVGVSPSSEPAHPQLGPHLGRLPRRIEQLLTFETQCAFNIGTPAINCRKHPCITLEGAALLQFCWPLALTTIDGRVHDLPAEVRSGKVEEMFHVLRIICIIPTIAKRAELVLDLKQSDRTTFGVRVFAHCREQCIQPIIHSRDICRLVGAQLDARLVLPKKPCR
mmetsp:Transcript_130806/g.326332  ORF Transcript_130806/g.326332 Transcript_130806/m.326332 type:complete len:210 (+) Transcript_130806:369-998(+)